MYHQNSFVVQLQKWGLLGITILGNSFWGMQKNITSVHWAFLFIAFGAFAEVWAVSDTILSKVYDQFYFLNVTKSPDGQVLCGTTAGFFTVGTESLYRSSSEAGYVRWDTVAVKSVISQDPVQSSPSYFWKHLLPPSLSNERVTFVLHENHCYLVAQGKLFVYELTPYKRSYQNLDVTVVSPDGVGGKFGVYLDDYLIDNLPSTPTDLKVLDTVTFICFQGFWAITKKDTLKFDALNRNNFLYNNQTYGWITELTPLYNHQYLMLCDSGVYRVNFLAQTVQKLAPAAPTGLPPQFIGQIEDTRYISIGSGLYRMLPQTGLFELLFDAEETILSGAVAHFNVFFLTSTQIFTYDLTSTFSIGKNESQVHSMFIDDDQIILLGSTQGLFALDINAQVQKEVLLDIHCNKGAMAATSDAVLIGTPTGLLRIPKRDLTELIDVMEEKKKPKIDSTSWSYFLVLLFSLITIAGASIFYKYLGVKKQLNIQSNQGTDLRLEEIEKFIYENLPRVNLPMLCSHFNISLNSIYKIMSPDRPGALIHRARMLVMIELEKQDATTEEIAAKTGFSVQYVQKIRRRIPIAS